MLGARRNACSVRRSRTIVAALTTGALRTTPATYIASAICSTAAGRTTLTRTTTSAARSIAHGAAGHSHLMPP